MNKTFATYSENFLPLLHIDIHWDKDYVGQEGQKVDNQHCQNGKSDPCKKCTNKIAAKEPLLH